MDVPLLTTTSLLVGMGRTFEFVRSITLKRKILVFKLGIGNDLGISVSYKWCGFWVERSKFTVRFNSNKAWVQLHEYFPVLVLYGMQPVIF